MKIFFDDFFSCIRLKKGYFIVIILASIIAITLAIFASINFSSGFLTIDLSNISYIKFLKGDTGMMSMIFSNICSLLIFFALIWICHAKPFLIPLGVIFYLYLVYSQAVILISLIMIYGFFNCIILAMLLLIYFVLIWFLFILSMLQMLCCDRSPYFFRSCCNVYRCKMLITLSLILLFTILFSFVITILKNFIILLVY